MIPLLIADHLRLLGLEIDCSKFKVKTAIRLLFLIFIHKEAWHSGVDIIHLNQLFNSCPKSSSTEYSFVSPISLIADHLRLQIEHTYFKASNQQPHSVLLSLQFEAVRTSRLLHFNQLFNFHSIISLAEFSFISLSVLWTVSNLRPLFICHAKNHQSSLALSAMTAATLTICWMFISKTHVLGLTGFPHLTPSYTGS